MMGKLLTMDINESDLLDLAQEVSEKIWNGTEWPKKNTLKQGYE